jgi:hypothetical protein
MVYPWPALSTTVGFENSLGLDGSLRKIALARNLLGEPHSRRMVRAHLYMPSSADVDSLAFLVSHCALDGEYDEGKMGRARQFVSRNMRSWEVPRGYKIPQGQVLELYNCHLPAPRVPE